MRGGLRFRILVVGVVAAAVGLVVAPAGIADTTNVDPTGDAKGGSPDIARVVTSNDALGVITFRITTVAPIIDSSIVGVDLDTDSNPGTGGGGFEYTLIADTSSFGILKWNGSGFANASARSLRMTRSGNVLVFKVNRADIGRVDRFGFDVFTVNYDDAGTFLGEDTAPDGGSYTYTLSLKQCGNGKDDDGDGKIDGRDLGCSSPTDNLESDDPVTLKAGKPLTVPAKPKAGTAVVVGVAVTRRETRAGITSGTARCIARVGSDALRANGKVRSGVVACGFTLPATSSGKVVHGTITVTVKGHSIKIPFTFTVS
jgi:hypothetical protein